MKFKSNEILTWSAKFFLTIHAHLTHFSNITPYPKLLSHFSPDMLCLIKQFAWEIQGVGDYMQEGGCFIYLLFSSGAIFYIPIQQSPNLSA